MSIVKESTVFVIDEEKIKQSDFVLFSTRDSNPIRGIVSYVQTNSIEVVDSFGNRYTLSAVQIGKGIKTIRKLEVIE